MDGVDPTDEWCARKTAPAESIKAVTSAHRSLLFTAAYTATVTQRGTVNS